MSYDIDAVERLIAERDALKAKGESDAQLVAVCERLLEENRAEADLLAELERLEVKLERHKVAFDALSVAFNSQQAQLTELREAAEHVVAWDWSDNDAGCVRDMEKLRAVVEQVRP